MSRDEVTRDSIEFSYPHQPEMWLCNHCSDYLSPDPSTSVVGTSDHGTQEHAFKHVQTAYVRFESAAMLVPPKIDF